MELIESVAALPNTTRFPPLRNELDQYQAASETALKCALKIDCTEKYSAKEVYNQVAIPIGVRETDFEHQCIIPILAEVHTGSFVCTGDHDFLTKNGTLDKELLLKTKPCILTIAENVCSTEDHVFFKDHYDELMNMYTTKPDDEFGLCMSPYDKFMKNYCENMVIRVENNMKSLKFKNLNETEANEISRQCEELQKCYEDSCLISKMEKLSYQKHCASLRKGLAEFSKFAHRDEVLENKCVAGLDVFDYGNDYHLCNDKVKATNCVTWAIEEKCGKIVVDESGAENSATESP